MEYHRLDDNHLEVLAGDIAKGYWNLADDSLLSEGQSAVKLTNNIEELTVRIKHKVGTLDTLDNLPVGRIVGMAIGVALGPFGGIAAKAFGMATGTFEFLCIGVSLRDGRKFIVRMRSTVFDKLKKLKG